MAHVTVWARPEDAGTRVFVRATIGRAGVFAHSSGLLERQILDAIQLRTPWRKSERDTVKDFSQPADDVWTAARDALRDSESVIVNAEDARARVITCSFSIPSNTFRQYTSARVDDYVPGAAHLTVWVEPTAKGARIRARALMHEFDSLAPTALASSGKLEAAVVAATTTRLDGENASVAGASTYRGKPDFLAALFQPPRTADAQDVWKQELPASAERVWIAALKVVTQSSIVVQSDRATGLVRFITAHASDAPAKYSVHQVELRMLSSQLGTTLTVTGNADEPSQEMVADRRLVVERIAAELFVKERLGWLVQDAGAVK
jgi:hypothetical protein